MTQCNEQDASPAPLRAIRPHRLDAAVLGGLRSRLTYPATPWRPHRKRRPPSSLSPAGQTQHPSRAPFSRHEAGIFPMSLNISAVPGPGGLFTEASLLVGSPSRAPRAHSQPLNLGNQPPKGCSSASCHRHD